MLSRCARLACAARLPRLLHARAATAPPNTPKNAGAAATALAVEVQADALTSNERVSIARAIARDAQAAVLEPRLVGVACIAGATHLSTLALLWPDRSVPTALSATIFVGATMYEYARYISALHGLVVTLHHVRDNATVGLSLDGQHVYVEGVRVCDSSTTAGVLITTALRPRS